MVRLAARLFPRPANPRQLSQRLVRRRGIRRDPIRHFLAEAADLAAQLDRHRDHLHLPGRAVRIGDRLRRLALPDPVRSAHVPAPDAAHDPADRDRGAAVALLFGARPARHQARADPDLFPHQPALRGVDDQELHRRSAARDRAGRRNSRRLALAHRVRDRAAADPLGPGRHLPVHPDPDLERVPAGAHHHQDAGRPRCRSSCRSIRARPKAASTAARRRSRSASRFR